MNQQTLTPVDRSVFSKTAQEKEQLKKLKQAYKAQGSTPKKITHEQKVHSHSK